MTKPVVLFVDDDANILCGLRRMLRGQRHRWEMVFAEGGQAACDVMDTCDVDVIVSDMRMPGVDGAMVMEHAQHAAPRAMRIILSGESDRALTLRTVGISHRFFAKPCDTSTIIEAVERPLALKGAFAERFTEDEIGDLMRLRTPADAYEAFTASLAAPTATVRDVSVHASNDPALAARLLQLANSAYFSPAKSVCLVEDAIERLGLDTVREVVAADRLTALGPSRGHENSNALLVHPYALSEQARNLAVKNGADDAMIDAAGCVGLLFGLGAQADVSITSDRDDQGVAVSAYLATLMGLPERVCEALCVLAESGDVTDEHDGAQRIVEALAAPMPRAA